MIRLFAPQAEPAEYPLEARSKPPHLYEFQPDGKIDSRSAKEKQEDVVPEKVADGLDCLRKLLHNHGSFPILSNQACSAAGYGRKDRMKPAKIPSGPEKTRKNRLCAGCFRLSCSVLLPERLAVFAALHLRHPLKRVSPEPHPFIVLTRLRAPESVAPSASVRFFLQTSFVLIQLFRQILYHISR